MISPGDRDNFSGDLRVTAPTGGYTKGKIYLIADSYWLARETAAAAATCLMSKLKGALWCTKAAATGKNFVVGDKVYVLSNVLQPATATGAVLLAGTVLAVAAATDTAVLVDFDGGIPPTAT